MPAHRLTHLLAIGLPLALIFGGGQTACGDAIAIRMDASTPHTPISPELAPKSAAVFALAGVEINTGDVLLRVVNRAAKPQAAQVSLRGMPAPGRLAKITTSSHADPMAESTVDHPDAMLPAATAFHRAGAESTYTFQRYSFTLIRLTIKRPLRVLGAFLFQA